MGAILLMSVSCLNQPDDWVETLFRSRSRQAQKTQWGDVESCLERVPHHKERNIQTSTVVAVGSIGRVLCRKPAIGICE
jgi:hypothetical protein